MFRTDRAQLPRVTKTPEGYLRGDAVVTRTGVLKYQNADGSIRAELRHPDDVLNDSLKSLRMVPITVNHPDEPVNVANAARYVVGSTGEYVRSDGNNVLVSLTITHKDAIAAVQGGKRELSLGYTLDLIREDGVFEGERYTHRQTNIAYNHLAIVDVARAGQAARLNLDGGSMFNRDEAIAEISRRCPNSDTSSKSFLKTKSDEYLATRLAAMDRSDVRADLRGHEPQIARYDGYGRIIPGTLRLDAEARTDAAREDAAYRKSVQNLNAWRGDDRPAPSGAPSGAPIESRWKADAAEIDADRARADAAYERGKANLNRRDR